MKRGLIIDNNLTVNKTAILRVEFDSSFIILFFADQTVINICLKQDELHFSSDQAYYLVEAEFKRVQTEIQAYLDSEL
ncbi:hypothetical protein C0W92_03190 [Photobacterium angustum]|uniref:Uncharacterized protein n=1 Tax=Photobacterium angustum TaxID=661 RepID=A0A855SE77_PHOAN|nr:hypothetical protein [Photobacterium angustum]KJF81680.1 hypothetical protein UB36_11725 [Photobacterium damselae subsp. damselae]KJG16766.1 hypothetical protein UA33_12065 [Photobacterium angustum]KJG23218.1 hypothetical protein UA39_12515 [Photobacterium angustum]KJG30249.1 hypothetical protein UA36_13530 [Photobacterium angustum]KJG30848.1 hypothetical protein UA69_09620 [Photobacterium angustum]